MQQIIIVKKCHIHIINNLYRDNIMFPIINFEFTSLNLKILLQMLYMH